MSKINIKKAKTYLLAKEKLAASLKQKERNKILADLKSFTILWKKFKLNQVFLYGSYADMSFNKYSDIDIAVTPDISFEDQLKLYSEINNRIERDVEVRLLSELPFSEKILREGVLIYERKISNT